MAKGGAAKRCKNQCFDDCDDQKGKFRISIFLWNLNMNMKHIEVQILKLTARYSNFSMWKLKSSEINSAADLEDLETGSILLMIKNCPLSKKKGLKHNLQAFVRDSYACLKTPKSVELRCGSGNWDTSVHWHIDKYYLHYGKKFDAM